jgi:hypothetical protein
MEIIMKTGKDMDCVYTKTKTDVLVTLKADEGGVSAGLLSEDALVQALNFIRAYKQAMGMASSTAVVQPQRQLLTEVPMQPAGGVVSRGGDTVPTPPTTTMSSSLKDPMPLVEQFAKAVADLVQNPPEDNVGKQKGLAEIHVRELISKWKTSFRDPVGSMFPVLNQFIGMPKERVEMLLS